VAKLLSPFISMALKSLVCWLNVQMMISPLDSEAAGACGGKNRLTKPCNCPPSHLEMLNTSSLAYLCGRDQSRYFSLFLWRRDGNMNPEKTTRNRVAERGAERGQFNDPPPF
jgi:hypothetical protein